MIDQKIINLARKLPTGAIDKNATRKMWREFAELRECLNNGDVVGALLEAGDCYYYWQKAMFNGRYILPLIIWLMVRIVAIRFSKRTIRAAALAKYALRARPGNPKNDDEERTAVSHLI